MSDAWVIGVDASTTALKAIAWDREGRAAAEARTELPLDRPHAHRYEQDPEHWWTGLRVTLRQLTRKLSPARISGIAIAHQRETVCATDASGEPLGPAILWLDQRARDWVVPLVERIGETRLRRISGKSPDFGPALYKLAWLRECRPHQFEAAHRFCDVQAWLVHRLTGVFATSWSSADPFGLLDIRAHSWSSELCTAAGVRPEQLCPPRAPGSVLGRVSAKAAAETGLAADTPVIAAGGDGQAAGLGVNALSTHRAYLNLGTAVVAGVFSQEPSVDRGWRTLTSCAEAGYILESSLRSGALLSDWYLKRLCGIDPKADTATLSAIEETAASLPPGSEGLLLVPYWEGAMNPYWDMQARGCILGLSDAHDRPHLYRALIEGVALEQALVMSLVRERTGLQPSVFAAIGGVAQSDLWCQIMADVLDTPVERCRSVEAASLGAAMCAAKGAGWYDRVSAAAMAMQARRQATFMPDAQRAHRYRDLLAIYRDLFPAVGDVQRRLSDFAS